MTRSIRTVRPDEALDKASDNGADEDAIECERDAFDRLQTKLREAFAAADSSYQPLTAAEVIARNTV